MTYFGRRILTLVPVLLLTWSLVFVIFELMPGDPITLMMGGTPVSDEVMANERARLGLDQPVYQRYLSFLGHAIEGDLGNSFRTREPVSRMVLRLALPSAELALGGLLIGILMGLTLGVLAAIWPGSWLDSFCVTLALAGGSLPAFWSGMLLIYVFGSVLALLPIVGTGWNALILPCVTVGLSVAGDFARLIRTSIIEAMKQDYVRTARAKGLSPLRVIGKHALRNALIPAVTLLSMQLSALIGGAVVTETVFARQGLGSALVDAVMNKDTPLVQAIVIYTTATYLIINLIIDIVYGLIDPRIRTARAA